MNLLPHFGTTRGMNLRRLRYFVTVAEELHFGRAAERLHMAQPPLSQQIRKLEEDLDLSLFDRSTRSVNLTDAGEALLVQAHRLLATSDSVDRFLDDFRAGDAGKLRLGFVDSSAYEVMPRFLREYRKRWPSVEFELRSMSSDQQRAALTNGEIDLGIGRTMGDGSGVEATPIISETLYLAVPSGHRLAEAKSVRLSRLDGQNFIGFDSSVSPTLHAELVGMFAAVGVGYRPIIEATEYTSILGLVAAGEGVAVVPAGVRSFQPAELRYVKISDAAAVVRLMMLRRRGENVRLVERGLVLATELFGEAGSAR